MIRDAPGVFETDDILEMVNADLVKITVADRYLANFWKQIFPGIVVREDLTVDAGNDIAFAFRRTRRSSPPRSIPSWTRIAATPPSASSSSRST